MLSSARVQPEPAGLVAHEAASAAEGGALRGEAPDLEWRVLSLLNGYRLFVSLLLLALFYLLTGPRAVGDAAPLLFVATTFLYLISAVGSIYLIHRRTPALSLQLYAQVGADIVAITLMMYASGGVDSGLGTLLVVPIGAASVLVDRRLTGVFPAFAALALLTEHLVSRLERLGEGVSSMPTGLLGATLFVVALAAQPLASRLRESEALARQRGVDLANMAQLNHYVIQHLRESLVVVDADDRVRLINDAAQKCLGVGDAARGRLLAELSPRLHAIVESWREDPRRLRSSPPLLVSADGSAMLIPNFVELGHDRPSALIVFLEDQSLIAERAQQSKLAALGRLSASIAHEIRNPVGAMSHAAQLLAESEDASAEDRRLSEIISNNAARISTIVDNVLQLSRPRHELAEIQRFRLDDWVDGFAAEYAASNQFPRQALKVLHEGHGLSVRMDPSHLHQVLWNLCDNALKYGAPDRESRLMELRTGRMPSSSRPYLQVTDYGPGIDEAVVERIFEPFYTSHHGGTGLGLFIARQLCEASGAALSYLPRARGGSIFRIVFADPDRWGPEDGRARA